MTCAIKRAQTPQPKRNVANIWLSRSREKNKIPHQNRRWRSRRRTTAIKRTCAQKAGEAVRQQWHRTFSLFPFFFFFFWIYGSTTRRTRNGDVSVLVVFFLKRLFLPLPLATPLGARQQHPHRQPEHANWAQHGCSDIGVQASPALRRARRIFNKVNWVDTPGSSHTCVKWPVLYPIAPIWRQIGDPGY